MLKFKTFEELLENEGLKKKAAKSGISYGTLKKVYNRGMAAWRTGHRPGTTPQQWGMARVNSYIGKGKGTYYGADADLRGKSKKEDVNEVSKDTLQKYHKKSQDYMNTAIKTKDPKMMKNVGKRLTGAGRAHDKLKEATVNELSKAALNRYVKAADKDKSKKHVQADIGKISRHAAHVNQIMRNRGITMAKSKMNPVKVKATEGNVQEISKGLAKRYIGKASRDAYFKGRDQGTVDAISAVGGSHPHQDYKKSPERKAAMRMRGIDRATDRLAKKEDKVSDAERKAMAAFIAKGKMKKLPPGKAAGYHGKSDPGSSMKGMISPADTKQFGTKKKVGSMK